MKQDSSEKPPQVLPGNNKRKDYEGGHREHDKPPRPIKQICSYAEKGQGN